MTRARRLSLACATALVAACGGGQTRLGAVFSTDWRDDGGAGVRAVQSRILGTPLTKTAPAAVGVVENGIVGIPLSSGAKAWSYTHAIDARPQVVGTVVVGAGDGEIFALDALTGRPLWAKRSGGALRGAGDDGSTTIVSQSARGESGSIVLVIAHDGRVVRQLETSVDVGVPGVAGGFAFLPWQGQYVTIYNTDLGEEQARLLFREQVSRAFAHGGKLYFGELGLFRFDEAVSGASKRAATHVSLPTHELPGDPKWFRPGTEARTSSADAHDKIAIYAAPGQGTPLALDSNRLIATYYKVAAGLDAKNGRIAWVRKNGADFIGGSAFDGGVALCDAAGRIIVLDSAGGRLVTSSDLGRKITSCSVAADGLVSGRSSPADPATAKERAETPTPLVDQLASAIRESDADLVAIDRLLLRELAKVDDVRATKHLIDLASDGKTPEALLPDVHAALASRKNGADQMIEALRRHYDFLKDVLRPPPVGPLADALLAMKEVRAAPVLVSHLFDPADTTDAVRRVAAALEVIATKTELGDLRTFFGLYRATAEDDNLAEAVVSVARALLRVGGPDDKALVTKGVEDPLTVPGVKTQLASVVQPTSKDP